MKVFNLNLFRLLMFFLALNILKLEKGEPMCPVFKQCSDLKSDYISTTTTTTEKTLK
ncbi:hypothetical protein M5D96_003949 [Drosophila gunungcola]|uniref:Uncharacterized protein n=1 Tax=Drosophila gunungcola TaxID=103775 RepID=A0A9Q0BSU4_9MUSC|nr:hypothetical protein M5D96_003949 [Drosophila gunungcola]